MDEKTQPRSDLVSPNGRLVVAEEHRNQASLRGSFERALKHHGFEPIDVSAFQQGPIIVVLQYQGYKVHRWNDPTPWLEGPYGDGAKNVAEALKWQAKIES